MVYAKVVHETQDNLCITDETQKLLPCPFCGGDAKLVLRDDTEADLYDVQCSTEECYLEIGADWWLPGPEVIELWNKRV